MSRCVRVSKREGECVRCSLMDGGYFDTGRRIRSDGDDILIPVNDSYRGETEDAEFEVQEHRPTDYRELAHVPEELREELPNSYDIVGDVAIVKLTDGLLPYKGDIGRALMAVTPSLRTVMLDSGVKGEFRIRDLEQIAGEGPSETVHKESGTKLATDPAKVYFNPRLATERERIAGLVRPGEVIIDMFAGVAPFGTVICKKAEPEVVYSIDLNPEAERFMRRNMELNHIANMVPMTGDARAAVEGLPQADRVLMNLPQSAEEFLDTALDKLKVGGTVHLHKILERAELEGFESSLRERMDSLGLPMHIAEVTELKTYSPTMSVYVFDIVRD